MSDEPKYYSETSNIGSVEITFRGEKYSGRDILDTSIKIEEGIICWITWEDKKAFVDEINNVIQKYRI